MRQRAYWIVIFGCFVMSGCDDHGGATPGEVGFWVCVVLGWIATWMLGMHVAHEKGRSEGEATVLSLVFGPFGVLILALLPTHQTSREDRPNPEEVESSVAYQSKVAQALDRTRTPLSVHPKGRIRGVKHDGRYAIECPHCMRKFAAPIAKMGADGKCPGCKGDLYIPSEEDAPAH